MSSIVSLWQSCLCAGEHPALALWCDRMGLEGPRLLCLGVIHAAACAVLAFAAAPSHTANCNPLSMCIVCPCSTQYKTVLDALRSRKERFLFEDVEIGLRTSVMAFM